MGPARLFFPNRLAVPAQKPFEYGRSEFRLVGLRDRNEALIEMILIVLGTDHFVERHFLLALVAPRTLSRVPRRCDCAGILNVKLDFLAAVAASAFIERLITHLPTVSQTSLPSVGPCTGRAERRIR
jgi:hypothetical protein